MLAPFGMENEEPIFHFKRNPSQHKTNWTREKPFKITIYGRTNRIDAIGFGMGHLYYYISPHIPRYLSLENCK